MSAGHVALVGRPVVVDEEAIGDVLVELERSAPDALCAALRWPEVREHTAEGELVQHCFRCYELEDPAAVIALLRRAPALIEREDALSDWEEDVVFDASGPPAEQVVEPPPARGVVWELCDEDRRAPRVLGEVIVSPPDGELTLSLDPPMVRGWLGIRR